MPVPKHINLVKYSKYSNSWVIFYILLIVFNCQHQPIRLRRLVDDYVILTFNNCQQVRK